MNPNLCRDCKHWLFSRRELLVDYPRNRPASEGYLDGVCPILLRTLTITATGGWDGCSVDSVETDANFGCVLFEPQPRQFLFSFQFHPATSWDKPYPCEEIVEGRDETEAWSNFYKTWYRNTSHETCKEVPSPSKS